MMCCMCLGEGGEPATLEPVDSVDLDKYVGNWYQMYTNQFVYENTAQKEGSTSVTVTYARVGDGKVSVENRECAPGQDGEESVTRGEATATDNPGVLSVKFEGVPRAFSYWIMKLGPVKNDLYDYAIVSSEKLKAVYVLARHYDSFKKQYDEEVLEWLKDNGFSEGKLAPIATTQGDTCTYADSFTEKVVLNMLE